MSPLHEHPIEPPARPDVLLSPDGAPPAPWRRCPPTLEQAAGRVIVGRNEVGPTSRNNRTHRPLGPAGSGGARNGLVCQWYRRPQRRARASCFLIDKVRAQRDGVRRSPPPPLPRLPKSRHRRRAVRGGGPRTRINSTGGARF